MFLAMFMVTGLPENHTFWTGDKTSHFSNASWNDHNMACDTALEGWRRE